MKYQVVYLTSPHIQIDHPSKSRLSTSGPDLCSSQGMLKTRYHCEAPVFTIYSLVLQSKGLSLKAVHQTSNGPDYAIVIYFVSPFEAQQYLKVESL
jgi:hypothetical protein